MLLDVVRGDNVRDYCRGNHGAGGCQTTYMEIYLLLECTDGFPLMNPIVPPSEPIKIEIHDVIDYCTLGSMLMVTVRLLDGSNLWWIFDTPFIREKEILICY